MKAGAIAVALAGVMAGAPFASAQSLGDLARQEDARRSTLKQPGRTITNADLKADPYAPSSSSAGAETAPAAGPGFMSVSLGRLVTAEELIARSRAVDNDRRQKDERSWRQKADALRQQLQKAQQEVDSLSTPADRGPRQQALTDKALAKAEKTLADLQARWLALEQRAQNFYVPKTWLEP